MIIALGKTFFLLTIIRESSTEKFLILLRSPIFVMQNDVTLY